MRILIGFGLIIVGGVLIALTSFYPLATLVVVGVFLFASIPDEAAFCDYVIEESGEALIRKRHYFLFLPFTFVSHLVTLGRATLKILWKEEYFKVLVNPEDGQKPTKISRKEYIALRNEQRMVYSTGVKSRAFMEQTYSLDGIGYKRKTNRLIAVIILCALELTMLVDPVGLFLTLIYEAIFLPMVILWIPEYKDAKILHQAYQRAMAQPREGNQ